MYVYRQIEVYRLYGDMESIIYIENGKKNILKEK